MLDDRLPGRQVRDHGDLLIHYRVIRAVHKHLAIDAVFVLTTMPCLSSLNFTAMPKASGEIMVMPTTGWPARERVVRVTVTSKLLKVDECHIFPAVLSLSSLYWC